MSLTSYQTAPPRNKLITIPFLRIPDELSSCGGLHSAIFMATHIYNDA